MKGADDIVKLLAGKHLDDVFVSECKNGPTHTASHLRLDAWVMKKSWSNPCTIGYEIKVNRSDFLNDDKWPAYLSYCNQFSFVCPAGLIDVSELPPEVGLICVSKTGTRLYTKRKAPHRSVEIPEDLYRYILMSRTRIQHSVFSRKHEEAKESGRDFWRRWLEEKKLSWALGQRIGRELRETIKKRVDEVAEENKGLVARIEKLETVERFVRDRGINLRAWRLEDQLACALAAVPPGLFASVQRVERECAELRASLAALNGGDNDEELPQAEDEPSRYTDRVARTAAGIPPSVFRDDQGAG